MPDKNLFDGANLRQEGFFARLAAGLASALEPSSGAPAMAMPGDSPVHFDMVREQGVLEGLVNEITFTIAELRRDPSGFAQAVFSPDVNDPSHKRTRRAAMALTMAVPALAGIAFFAGVMIWKFFTVPVMDEEVASAQDVRIIDPTDFKTDLPKDIPKADKRAGGGGGGGKQEPTPPKLGKPPSPSMTPPLIAPTTKPTLRPPSLPVMPTVQVDKDMLKPNLDPNSIGDPKGVEGPPSDGMGKGGGIGNGNGSGIGVGNGGGVGPGEGRGIGGGQYQKGGNTDPEPAIAKPVSPVQITFSPRPNFTEAARQNKTQGVVQLRVVFGANGSIKSAKVVKGLPDGLNEKAIEAAYQFRFVPAKNGSGQPVDATKVVAVNFTLR